MFFSGSSALEKERARLMAILERREKVYDESGKEIADAAKEDMETLRATWKLELLEKFGALKRFMPGEIIDLMHEAEEYLQNEAKALDKIWSDNIKRVQTDAGALAAAIRPPKGRRYTRSKGNKKSFWGAVDKLADSLNGILRLRLQHLIRFSDDIPGQDKLDPEERERRNDKRRADAKKAINDIINMLGDGETQYAREQEQDRLALWAILNTMFDGNLKEGRRYLERLR